jgi:hypothetical protein
LQARNTLEEFLLLARVPCCQVRITRATWSTTKRSATLMPELGEAKFGKFGRTAQILRVAFEMDG